MKICLKWLFICVLCTSALIHLDLVSAGKNFYDLLQVSKGASEAQLKRAYRKLALQYHPDKNVGDEEANKKFAEINHAYEILSDAEKRKIYDQHGEEGLKQQQQRGGGGGGHQDIFSQFFGGGFGGFGGFGQQEEEDQVLKGETVVLDIECSLRDLYLGRTIKVVRDKNVIKPAKGTRQCNCKNKMVTKQVGPGMFQQYQQQECEQCPNVKYVREASDITVEVEPGMKDNQEISFFEEGEPVIDGEPGDLKFKIKTAPNKKFRRDGNHLHYEMTISLVDALVGFELTVEHLDGHKVPIKSTKVTKPGDVVKVAQEGMPLYDRAKKFGDLFIHYTVAFPKSLTEAQKEVVKKTFN
mmetsp:Transcript_25606/g.35363  ORF Transcript_25606/g.35363 Transcript_25606/m.35363 type:complete len:354 (-) Transcript_25606:234-1295(-)|eukprot:CAMPEP_0196588160 /NCGR_PEP_ID=MMETSP1081-20130531/59720_1 /TAXON_ID=36882 /ORGANISM="Pyramimonas amylifera, Strain CCMP720" /LENGTH=353 /DNA_ID=CAMNT_0041910581 /DNA_START=121 /DNA_END=1182 /DNA_ORIENTATION=+